MSILPFDSAALRYTRVAVVLHWLVAALLVAQFTWGWWMQSIPKQPPGVRVDAFNLHKSAGLLLLALMVLRLGWRLAHAPPPLAGLARGQQAAARATHVLLYALLLAMPLSGYLGSVFSGYPVRWFGLRLPDWGWSDPTLKNSLGVLHLAASWILLLATLLHVAAALRHALARDGVVRRMTWPRRQPAQPSRLKAAAP